MLRQRAALRLFSASKTVVTNEFLNNPHFDRAFPHLLNPIYPPRDSKVSYDMAKEGYDHRQDLGKDLKEHNVTNEEQPNWAESLLHKRQTFSNRIIDHESLTQKTYIDGYRTPVGPLKWMPAEEKEKVHKQATLKLQTLEDTGLSREEILYKRPGGIMLAEDPVFQYIKNNFFAREMLMRPGQELTVENIVEVALCAKIDVDRAKILPERDYGFDHEYNDDYEQLKNRGLQTPDKIQPRDYYWSEDLKGKFKEYIHYRSAPRVLFPEPINRRKTWRKNLRTIPVEDINFRNVELLTQFLTEAGKIKNKYQTRLPGNLQKKVSKAIKQARDLNLLPHKGMITEVHKRNLIPWFVEDVNRMVLHPETGQVYSKREAQGINMPRKTPTFKEQSLLESVYEDADILDARAKNLSIPISSQSKLNKDSVTIAEARDHIKSPRNSTVKSYEAIAPLINDIEVGEIGATFLREHSLDPSLFEQKKPKANDADVMELWKDLVSFKNSIGLTTSETVPQYIEELANP